MFLFRTLFWLGLLVMLLPPAGGEGPPPRTNFVEAAVAARVILADISGLCDRNPDACTASREAMSLVGRKIVTGADIVVAGIAAGRTVDPRAGVAGVAAGDPASTGTLTASDLEPAWTMATPQN